jgi:hypothetical protein
MVMMIQFLLNLIQFSFICVATYQPEGHLQSEYEWKKGNTHTMHKAKHFITSDYWWQ